MPSTRPPRQGVTSGQQGAAESRDAGGCDAAAALGRDHWAGFCLKFEQHPSGSSVPQKPLATGTSNLQIRCVSDQEKRVGARQRSLCVRAPYFSVAFTAFCTWGNCDPGSPEGGGLRPVHRPVSVPLEAFPSSRQSQARRP